MASVVGNMGTISSGDLAFDKDGNLFLSASGAPDRLRSINPNTGAGVDIGSTGFANVFGLAFAADGTTLYGFTAAGQTLNIDTATGAGAFLNNNNIATFGAAPEPVPEPATLSLLGIGLLAGAAFRKRFQR